MRDKKLDVTQSIPTFVPKARGDGTDPAYRLLRADVAGLSDCGKVRQQNEDNFLIARVGRSLDTLSTSLPEASVPNHFADTGYLMIVADGMGGHAAGEVASRTAIGSLINLLIDVPDWIMRFDEETANEIAHRAAVYYRKVHSAIADRAEAEPELRGMGTTMTVGYSVGPELIIVHVGDSRAYLKRDGELRQLTRDHTHVQRLIDAGVLSKENAATHRLRHVLTNALGGHGKDPEVDVHRIGLAPGDHLLLCSDGLTEVVDDGTIAETLDRAQDSDAACRRLVDLALEGGAPDNVTAVTARYFADG